MGAGRIRWLGPGFLWMVSAAGSGELLFSPRVGSLYGYVFLWALLLAVAFKWFINREIGRFAVCTGQPILVGFKRLPGPGNWALWLIVVPQLFVAVATIAGLASGAATAAILIVPGGATLWTIALLLLATALVYFGGYGGVEKAATALALALAGAAVVAAASVLDSPGTLLAGFVPSVPQEVDWGEILPWLGFALSGAAGMMWYSYWLVAKGYGAAGLEEETDPTALGEEDQKRLRLWIGQLTLDNSIAVVGTFLIMLAFLILGVELLRPAGLVPAEDEMAATLGQLFAGVWGSFGYWFMIAGVLMGFWSTVLSDQDGFARLFANGTRLLQKSRGAESGSRWRSEDFLKRAFLVALLTTAPLILYLVIGRPVLLLQIAGGIEAAHLPVLAGLTLFVNHRALPETLRPSALAFWGTTLAGLFFGVFALLYLSDLAGIVLLN